MECSRKETYHHISSTEPQEAYFYYSLCLFNNVNILETAPPEYLHEKLSYVCDLLDLRLREGNPVRVDISSEKINLSRSWIR